MAWNLFDEKTSRSPTTDDVPEALAVSRLLARKGIGGFLSNTAPDRETVQQNEDIRRQI
jgi:hypothetical protein